jgi:hypothetical protein
MMTPSPMRERLLPLEPADVAKIQASRQSVGCFIFAVALFAVALFSAGGVVLLEVWPLALTFALIFSLFLVPSLRQWRQITLTLRDGRKRVFSGVIEDKAEDRGRNGVTRTLTFGPPRRTIRVDLTTFDAFTIGDAVEVHLPIRDSVTLDITLSVHPAPRDATLGDATSP